MANDSIHHQIIVSAGPAGAFEAFTVHLGAWWPLAYTFSGPAFADAQIQSAAGGTWFEHNTSGEVLSWGEVRAFEPGARLVLAFAIGADRKPAPADAASEVEVRFSAGGPGRTTVAIEHRDFARHGEGADALRAGMDSAQGWPLILAELRRWIARRPVFRSIVSAMDPAVEFYTEHLGFAVDMRPAPGFAALSRGSFCLYLNEPGAGGAGATLADGARPQPGGWMRVQLRTTDLKADVERLRRAGARFRSDIIEGNGGRQALLEDPSGNLVELLEPRQRTDR